jgi:mono/diheme cytochrome c family protein
MRFTRTIAVPLVATAAAALFASCAQQQNAVTTSTAMDPVARGRYLVTIMSCGDCHTPGTFYGAPDTTRRLSGSDLGWVGPWGVVHARNLTPDSTGIGSWTEEDIAHTLRTGNTPDGRQLAVVMPWLNFAGVLTDEDAMAIAAYLKSLPPIHHVNLPVQPPGQKPVGATIAFPPPPAWDAQNLPPPGGTK